MDISARERKCILTSDQRLAVFHFLATRKKDPDGSHELMKGTVPAAAALFQVTEATIRKIYNRGRQSLAEGNLIPDVAARQSGRSGQKQSVDLDVEAISAIPLTLRQNIRTMAHNLKISKSTLHRRIKEQTIIKPHTSAIKPTLNEKNRLDRVLYCISHLNFNPLRNEYSFDAMFNTIHIDEKWFYLTKASNRYYLAAGEEPPHRTVKSKSFINKVMFIAAVARPRYDSYTQRMFDGKLGIWAFVQAEPARRNSKNRRAGTMETKAITSIGRVEITNMMTATVFPAIAEKWPRGSAGKIYLQQDNAKPHARGDDPPYQQH